MPRFIDPAPRYEYQGEAVAYGLMYFYNSGTNTPKTTFADASETIPNTNPVQLNAAGVLPNVFFSGTAKIRLVTSPDAANPNQQVFERDPVGAEAGSTEPFAPWLSDFIYSKNDIVEGSDSKLYLSTVGNNQNNNPVEDVEEWAFIQFIQDWTASQVFYQNNICYYDGTLYKSDTDGNINNQPDTSTDDWTVVALSQAITDALYLRKDSNLSDLDDAAAARTNLEVNSTSEDEAKFLQLYNNLDDLDDVETARTNLDVYSKSEVYSTINFDTVSNAQSGTLPNGDSVILKSGDVIRIEERGNGLFKGVSSATPNGYNILDFTENFGVYFELAKESMCFLSSYGCDVDTNSHPAMQFACDQAGVNGFDLYGTGGVTYSLDDTVVLGSDDTHNPFTIDFNRAIVHTTGEFTALLCIKGDVRNLNLSTDGDYTNPNTIGVEIGRYPDYSLSNYVGKKILNVKCDSSFYRAVSSEIELDGFELDNFIYFMDVGDAVISLTNGNPEDGSRSAAPRLTAIHLSNQVITDGSAGSYESGTVKTGLRLTSTEDAYVRGIINSYDVMFDSTGTSGGERNNRNLDITLHRDSHYADAARQGATFETDTAYAVDDYVFPTINSDSVGHIFKCTVAGTSASSEPTWNETYQGATVSGTATFTKVLFIANYMMGNDSGIDVGSGVMNTNNVCFLLTSAATINLGSGVFGNTGVISVKGDSNSIIKSTENTRLIGDFSSNLNYYMQAGTRLQGLLGYTDTTLTTNISSSDINLNVKSIVTESLINKFVGTELVTPFVNATDGTFVDNNTLTTVFNVSLDGINSSSTLNLKFSGLVRDTTSVARQIVSGNIVINSLNVANDTPVVELIATTESTLIQQGSLTTPLTFSITPVIGGYQVKAIYDSNVPDATMRLKFTPITNFGNLISITQL